jgi:hypothetical protein
MRGYGAGFRYYRQSERKMTGFSGTVQNREVRKVAGERSYWILDFYRRRSDRLMSLNLQKIVAVETDGIRMKKRSEQELKFMLGIGRSLAEPGLFQNRCSGRQEVFPMYSSEAIGHRIAGAGFSGLTSVAHQRF